MERHCAGLSLSKKKKEKKKKEKKGTRGSVKTNKEQRKGQQSRRYASNRETRSDAAARRALARALLGARVLPLRERRVGSDRAPGKSTR